MSTVMFLAAAIAGAAPLPAGAEKANRPNIVLFLVDDMGWQETSVPFHSEVTALNKRYRTPNMERLAAEGMKFTQAYASAVCSPTRVSLLSGMNAARHRVTNWTLRKDRSPDNPSRFVEPPKWCLNGVTTLANVDRATRITPLPALLRNAGYRTIHAGKAHFGAKSTPGEDPRHFGFDVNIGGHAAGGPGSYWGEKNFSAAWRKEDRIWDVPGLEAYHGKDVYLTEALTLEAIKAVESAVREKKPFYLYLSHYAVHAPWEKDNRFHQKYLDAGLKPFEATLASMIEGMDKSLGDMMEALERLGVEKDTVILFVSDNGSPSNCPRNLPLRGHKVTPYEGGVRVPMIARWPGVTRPGSVNSNPLIVEDFFPTILEIAAAANRETVQAVDGINFTPLLTGDGKTPPDRAFVWHYPHQYSGQGPYSSLRQGPWKLVHHHIPRKLELYNLADDLGEKGDLAPSLPDRVKALGKVLGDRLRAMDAQMPRDKVTGMAVEWADRVDERPKPAAKNVDVYLLGGQSNMQGVGKVADLPADIPREIPHARFWNGREFEPLVLGKTKTSTQAADFGPEVGFALGMATPERPVHLIKHHASGMPLHHGWHGGQWLGGDPAPDRRNFYPGIKSDDPDMGILYAQMRARFLAGVNHLRAQGISPNIRGFLWMQGEQDAKHHDSASGYPKSLIRLRRRLAEDMGAAPDLPLVFGQVLPHHPPAARFTHRDGIRAMMAACDSASGKPEAMVNTAMVSTDGFSLLSDTVHYDAAGQMRLGRAMAFAMGRLVGPKPGLRVMTFNILQGGGDASNVGFGNMVFGGSRFDELADVIRLAKADVVGVQEDCPSGQLLEALGKGWTRAGSVYSRLPLRKVSVEPFLTVVDVQPPGGCPVKLVNCHWFPPRGGYGPDLAQEELRRDPRLADGAAAGRRIVEKCAIPGGARGYNATLKPIKAAVEAGETVILTGDFNEPSHLDWTEKFAASGADRWVGNPTGVSLRMEVRWPGSLLLESAGLTDSFRAVHPDEVGSPGITWTPKYKDGTPGRRPYKDQVLDRIDRVYHTGKILKPRHAAVVGEDAPGIDIVYPGPWPSDHRAVVVDFVVPPPS